ncbi:MAG: hypothetical protein AB8E15_01480 [Bdellovibrionales bacterium]
MHLIIFFVGTVLAISFQNCGSSAEFLSLKATGSSKAKYSQLRDPFYFPKDLEAFASADEGNKIVVSPVHVHQSLLSAPELNIDLSSGWEQTHWSIWMSDREIRRDFATSKIPINSGWAGSNSNYKLSMSFSSIASELSFELNEYFRAYSIKSMAKVVSIAYSQKSRGSLVQIERGGYCGRADFSWSAYHSETGIYQCHDMNLLFSVEVVNSSGDTKNLIAYQPLQFVTKYETNLNKLQNFELVGEVNWGHPDSLNIESWALKKS